MDEFKNGRKAEKGGVWYEDISFSSRHYSDGKGQIEEGFLNDWRMEAVLSYRDQFKNVMDGLMPLNKVQKRG